MPPQFAALSPYIKQSAGVVGSVYGYTSLDNIGERNITAKQGEFQRFSCAARKEVTLYMVFVLDTNKQPLHPCHPARARKLLRGWEGGGVHGSAFYHHSEQGGG